MARKSKKSKGSKKGRAGKSGAKKSSAKKSSAKNAASNETAVVESVAELTEAPDEAVEGEGVETSPPEAHDAEAAAPAAETPPPKKKRKGKAKKKAAPEAEVPEPPVEVEAAGETAAEESPPEESPPEETPPEPVPGPRAKKKRRGRAKARKKDEPAAPAVVEPEPTTMSLDDDLDEPELVAISLDDDLDEAELVALPLDDDDEPELVTFSLDDDLDDHEARDRLIAEALAFVAAEEGEGPPPVVAAPEASADLIAADLEGTVPAESDGPAADDDGGVDDGVDGARARPQFSVDALLALSEMRSQGITLPGELILDLGEGTTPQERDRLLAAAMAHAEMQEAIYRIPTATRRDTWIKAGITSAILFLALVIAVWPPRFLVPEPPRALTAQDAVRGVRVTLLLQAQQIEAFRVNADRLPVSLEEAGATFDGVRYVRSGNRLYQLVAYKADGEPVIYDSAAPAPEFQALARGWLPSGDGS